MCELCGTFDLMFTGLQGSRYQNGMFGLALFCMLQSVIIINPTLRLIEESNTDARYFLEVLLELTTSFAMLCFIFGPLIAHQRAFQKRKGTRVSLTDGTRVSGFGPSTAENPEVASLDLIEARQRIADLEANVKSLNTRVSDLMGPERRPSMG